MSVFTARFFRAPSRPCTEAVGGSLEPEPLAGMVSHGEHAHVLPAENAPVGNASSSPVVPRYAHAFDPSLSRLVRRCGAALLLQMSETGLLSIVLLVFAHVLGSAAFGDYAFALTLATVLVMLARAGVDVSAVRFVSQYAARGQTGMLRGYQRVAWRAVITSSTVVAGLFAIVTTVMSGRISPDLTLCCFAAAALIPCLALLHLTCALLRGFHYAVLSRVPQGAIVPAVLTFSAGGVWALANLGLAIPAWSLVLLHVLAAAAGLTAGLLWLQRVRRSLAWCEPPAYATRDWARSAGLLVVLGGLTKLHAEVDVLMLGCLLDTEQAGIYAVVFRLAGIPMLICVAASAIVAPTMAGLAANGQRAALNRLFRCSVWMIAAASLPAAALILWLGEPILGLAGPRFVTGYAALVVLVIGNVLHNVFGPVGVLLNMAGHERTTVCVFAVSVFLNALLNLILIPSHGLIGAAVGTSAALLLIQTLLAVAVWRRLRVPWPMLDWLQLPVRTARP